jgi:hypothetical protein
MGMGMGHKEFKGAGMLVSEQVLLWLIVVLF